jgi:hypothetical protein
VIVVSLDPGKAHVGLACWASRRSDLPILLVHATFHNAEEKALEALIQCNPDVVVSERYTARPGTYTRGAHAAERTLSIIARAETLALDMGARFVLQSPADAKLSQRTPYWKRWLDSNPDEFGSMDSHARMAALHGFYYLTMGKGSTNSIG